MSGLETSCVNSCATAEPLRRSHARVKSEARLMYQQAPYVQHPRSMLVQRWVAEVHSGAGAV